jgi:succinate-semialdehyde dehydrogenase/glutarate-semialdehyde dehydrogenase
VEVRTDCGITGGGDGAAGEDLLLARPEMVIGRSPFEVEAIFEDLRRYPGHQERPGASRCGGLDTAIWDALGQAVGLPVSRLIGAQHRTAVRPYCTALYRRDWPDLAAGLCAEARRWKAQGFQSLKMNIGYTPETDVRIVRAVREAVGGETGLAVDSNCAYSVGAAVALGRRLEEYNLLWWEEPILAGDLAGYGTGEDYETVVNALEWYAQEMRHARDVILTDVEETHRHQVISQPLGVAVAFLAWNFPLLNVGFKLGPALAAGCSIILRPSSSSPLSAYVLAEICRDVEFPAGVVNILCGPADPVAKTLSSSPIPRLVTMIGSSETGRRLIAESATTVKRMSMELGGNAPVLVFPDADVEAAARDVAALKYGNCGQICVSPNRIFVHRDLMPRFEELLRTQASRIKVGFGRENQPSMGPLIDAQARQRVQSLVDDAVAQGAELVCGSETPASGKGFFYPATILRKVRPEMRVAREEVFGPVASLIEFEDEDAVVREANNTEYGLVAYLYTRDLARSQRIAERLEAGEVQINGFKYSIYLPHGGVKESGIGKDCSYLALDDYLVKKRITVAV